LADDIFTIAIKKLQEMGAFNFLFPFMLTTAIFYGLLRKSKVFTAKKDLFDANLKKIGEIEVSESVNAVVALIAGFMVWTYPILSGVNIEQQLSTFFLHGLIVTLVLLVVMMIMSMFMPPDLPTELQKQFLKGGTVGVVLVAVVVIGVIIFLTSGLINLIAGPIFASIDLGNDTVMTIVVLGLLILPIIFIFRGSGTITTDEKENNKGGK